jgi:hypothetical protein
MKQIMDTTKNPVRDEISVENSRKSVRIPSAPLLKDLMQKAYSIAGIKNPVRD